MQERVKVLEERKSTRNSESLVRIPVGSVKLEGTLSIPDGAEALVLFAHGGGSSRLSPRNNYVAQVLRKAGLATLLFDLLTEQEDRIYENRFDIPLIAKRLMSATQWIKTHSETEGMRIGYFGASTGAAAALQAAAEAGQDIGAIVSRGGRPDLAEPYLPSVHAPTLLIVGERDDVVIKLNKEAFQRITAEKDLVIVPGASHLFEEPGKLEDVARLATNWFTKYLRKITM